MPTTSADSGSIMASSSQLVLSAEINWGQATNYDTSVGPPVLAKANNIQFQATVRPLKGLTIDNTYLMTRLRDVNTNANMFNNHIIRSKWNYQFTRELSLRIIGQYNAVLSNYNAALPAVRLEFVASRQELQCRCPADLFRASRNGGLRGLQQQSAEPDQSSFRGWFREPVANARTSSSTMAVRSS